MRDRVREDFTVLSGDDYFYLPALALGAYGCVSVAGHLCSRELRAMADAFDSGDVETAGRVHRDLHALFTALFAHPSPIPVKWAMNDTAFAPARAASPMGAMPEDLKAVLAAADRSVPAGVIRRTPRSEILGCRVDAVSREEAVARIADARTG